MKSSHAKKASISLPAPLDAELRRIAKREHRTLSGVLQEAARYYVNIRNWEELQREVSKQAAALGLHDEDGIDKLVHT